MKLLHLGDLHLGKSLGDFDLKDDQEYILNEILSTAKEREIDAVLLAGDIYDRAVPSETATNLLDYFLSELAKLNITVFVISGNHDSDDRLNFGSNLFKTNNIFISSVFDGFLHSFSLTDEFGEVDFYLLPFVKASQVKRFYPDEEINTYEDAVKTVIADAKIDFSKRNVILSHQFIAGKNTTPTLSGSESLGTLSVGLVERIGYEIFNDFDYVALGHIHHAQYIGKESIRYSGSPLKYSLNEANNDKTMPLITLGKKGEVNIELIPLKPLRDLRHVKGNLNTLLSKENIKSPNDFMYVTLTDEDIISDAIGIIRQYYPNTVKIDYDNSHTKAVENMDISRISKNNKPFDELISDFYSLMYGCEISEDELNYIKNVAEEAGIKDETN